jgi:hypothetical protein
MYYSDGQKKYKCMNEHCLAEGETLMEVREAKARRDAQLKGLWEQLK